MMKNPLLTTYVCNEEELDIALQYGADALIFDDSKVSVRSFSDDFSNHSFDKFFILEKRALSQNSSVELIVNCDLMLREKDFVMIEKLFESLRKTSLRKIRVQDLGLIFWIQKYAPEFEVHVSTEMGNNHLDSIRFFCDQGVKQQTFTNEMTRHAIKNVINSLKGSCRWELMIQGLLLIQYSARRMMSSFQGKKKIWTQWAYDEKKNKHPFLFYDNPHGHLMYFWADRCLLEDIATLKQLDLDSWLIDVRGTSYDYLKTSLKIYRELLDTADVYEKKSLKIMKKNLEQVSGKPFRPLFFRENKTDFIKKKND